jgi:hypothetical protein
MTLRKSFVPAVRFSAKLRYQRFGLARRPSTLPWFGRARRASRPETSRVGPLNVVRVPGQAAGSRRRVFQRASNRAIAINDGIDGSTPECCTAAIAVRLFGVRNE